MDVYLIFHYFVGPHGKIKIIKTVPTLFMAVTFCKGFKSVLLCGVVLPNLTLGLIW